MIGVRNLLVTLAALAAVPAFAGTATAHVEMTPAEAPAGQPVRLSLHIGHGCDGAATTAVVVQVPSAASGVKALPVTGWKAKTSATEFSWRGGPLPDHHEQSFPFRATLEGEKGETVMFKSIQKCEGGASTAWIQPVRGNVEPELPAPALTLTSTAKAPDAGAPSEAGSGNPQVAEEGEPASSSDEGGGKSLLLIIVAGLAIGTIAGLVVRSRRR